jgi:23S rRNA pseudouridine2605 synthase
MRLHRALARAGYASRRRAESLIAEGRVQVNGAVARIGQPVNPSLDRITVDGLPVPLLAAPTVWVVLHKPQGVMTTRGDPHARRTVFDLVDDVPGLTYVGRLDRETEGVLLLTTDGDAVHCLTHPSRQVDRAYVATVRGDAAAAAARARDGVDLSDGPVHPDGVVVRPLGRDRWEIELVLREGRKREVRRLLKALGLEVERLVRTRFGPVRLGGLAPGASRPLTALECEELAAIVGHEVN